MLNIGRSSRFISDFGRLVSEKKIKFLLYLMGAVVSALILSLAFGDNYNGDSWRPKRSPERRRREIRSTELKDPFANRPRIQTRNGHLVIEASQDKNIDFRTSGSRGTVTINGHKLDQLLDVTKALEKSAQLAPKNKFTSSADDHFEFILSTLYNAGERFSALDKKLDSLGVKVTDLDKQVQKLARRLASKQSQVSKLSKKQAMMFERLKRNDCLNSETGQPVCKNGATCIDIYDGFKCLCPPNYEGPTCERDVDECANFRGTDLGCQNGAKCVNLPGSYRCECTTQYHGVHCTEQHDDCSLSSSRSLCGNGKCINLARAVPNQARYECICEQGWTTDGINPACVIDINECLVGQISANQSVLADNSSPWSNSLMAAYPCSQNPFVDCINLPGSFKCGPCPPGYSGNGRVCRDIDECSTNNGGCSTSPLVECINTPGSRRCGLCPAGFTGDGLTCSRISACSAEPNGGCHPMAKCVEMNGVALNSRLCICQYPFVGQGVGELGCKLLRPNPASSNGSSESELPDKQDDCVPNPCLNGGKCQLTRTSFECICPLGFTGRLCDNQASTCGTQFSVTRGSLRFPTGGSYDELKRTNLDGDKSVSTNKQYSCKWSIFVGSNSSVQLSFKDFINKLNPSKKIVMFLANSTSNQAEPTCSEILIVRERLDLAELGLQERLLAQFCAESRDIRMKSVPDNKEVSITSETSSVELEYTFHATRTQFGEPSLAFNLTWSKIDARCGGELPVAEFGSVSSPKFPDFYPPGSECRYLVRVPPGKRIRLQFGELTLLTGLPRSFACSDSLTILDGSIGSDRPVLLRHCANDGASKGNAHIAKSILSSSSSVEIVLSSHTASVAPPLQPKQKRGFYLTYASEPTTPGCGGLYTVKSATIKSFDYEPATSSAVDPRYALEISKYFEGKDSRANYQSNQTELLQSQSTGVSPRGRWFMSRCEYEIRPTSHARNHRISLDWLDMPHESPTGPDALNLLSRKLRCNRNSLIVYDGDPLDGGNRTEIARFCAGDRFSANASSLKPIVSSGHVLYLVYESYQSMSEFQPDNSDRPYGFKLHYSTICTAEYRQLSSSIQVELDLEVSECTHHIVLPPNNTISLIIEPQIPTDSIMLPQLCAVQAVFMDGSIQNKKQTLESLDRQLRTYEFGKSLQSDARTNKSRVGDMDDPPDDGQGSKSGETSTYWQYSSSQVHDIKEFEVCKLPVLSFDSIWNHLSLLFRLNPLAIPLLKARDKMRLSVKYQAEPACGGIVSEWHEGASIKLDSSRRISALNSFPITVNRFEKLHREEFSNPCAWILHSKSDQVIQLKFESPVAEIQSRFDSWLNWSRRQNRSSSRKVDGEFDCNQVFLETIELYEPSLNRTRKLCPIDLATNISSSWTSQSDTLLIRLRNDTSPTNASSIELWPNRRALSSGAIVAKYTFVSNRDSQQCGGYLIQESGLITSPRYPFNYPANSNCVWIIQTSAKQQVRLNITKFELEGQRDCIFDHLELRNGPSRDSPLIGRFCNRDLQSKVIIGHSNSLWINFKSDGHLSRPGFEIYYDGAQTGCGGRLTSSSGQIDSPNYPQPYAHSGDCEWAIEVSQSNKVEITFADLDLSSASSNCSTLGAKPNYIEIFDSGSDFLTRSIGKFCHLSEMNQTTFRSSQNKMFIVYKSQALDNSRGFRLNYRTVCKPIEIVGFRGVIESPGFPASYVPRTSCGWTIRAPLGSNITLAITDLDLEQSANFTRVPGKNSTKFSCYEDVLNIWAIRQPENITNATSQIDFESEQSSKDLVGQRRPKGGKLMRSLCGELSELKESDRAFEVDTNVVYVSFESDRTIEMRGFRIEWQSVGCGGQQTGETIQMISYYEKQSTDSRPTECLWVYDLSRSANSIEFILNSDMRSQDSSSASRDPCLDASLTIFDGLTLDSPILSRNCDSQKMRETMHTSSGFALVRFYTSGRHNYGRGFLLNGWPSTVEICMRSTFDISSPFNQLAGTRQSPNYPDLYEPTHYQCHCLLSAHSGRLRFRIDELDIPVSSEEQAVGLLDAAVCRKSGNYLGIKHLSGQSVEEIYCGKLDAESALSSNDSSVARTKVIMEQEAAWLEFYSGGGFRGRWKVSFDRLCGSVVLVDYPREFTSPNYPSEPKWPRGLAENTASRSENVCLWILGTNRPGANGKGTENKISLNIVDFQESSQIKESPSDCLRVFEGVDLNIRTDFFNLTDIDSRLQPKIKICKQSDLKYSSLHYAGHSGELIVMVSGLTRAKFRVRPFENACGGEFSLNQAEFASLGYPQPYPPNLDCHYFITGSPGSQIKLRFAAFDLPDGESSDEPESNGSAECENVDHIEIRQLPLRKKLRVKLNAITSTYSSEKNSTFIIGDGRGQDQIGTAAKNATGRSIRVSDRLYDRAKLYHLLVETTSEQLRPGANLGRVVMTLGDFYENSNLIGRFCGKQAPILDAKLLQDEILVRFRSHGLGQEGSVGSQVLASRGFLAEYSIEYGGLIQIVDRDSMEGALISSPKFPTKYRHNGSIRWTFETKLDSVLVFDLIRLDLGSDRQDCQDTLSIYDGSSLQSSPKLSDMCGYLGYKNLKFKRLGAILSSTKPDSTYFLPIYSAFNPRIKSNLVRSVRTSANLATVVYDNYRNEGMFLLRYKAISKSQLTSTGNRTNITDAEVLDADLAIQEQEEPLPDATGAASKGCSFTSRLSLDPQNASEVVLTSPNWPQPPQDNIECHWLVYTHENTNIKLSVDPTNFVRERDTSSEDSFGESRKPDYCLNPKLDSSGRNYIAVYDGAIRLSPLIGRYCLPVAPIQLQSTGRHMFIRYVRARAIELAESKLMNRTQKSLFKAIASVGGCGGQYHIMSSARIRDRQTRSKTYANNLNCKYYLFAASQDQVLIIHNGLSEFDLSNEPTNADCSIGDYIEIRDLPIQADTMEFSRSTTGRLLARFCAGHKLEYFESPGSALTVEFVTDGKNGAGGWELYAMSSLPRVTCPRGLMSLSAEDSFGQFTSPSWPHGFFGKRHCKYQLVAPANQSILVHFVRLNRPIEGGNFLKCLDRFHYLADNEVSALRYDTRPLPELQSPFSGTLLRKLVQRVPCRMQPPGSDSSAGSNSPTDLLDAGNRDLSSISSGFKKLTADKYFAIFADLPKDTFSIKTDSHMLQLDYETTNLLPNQGFMAIYRLTDDRRFKCGGDVAYEESQNKTLASTRANNLIESAAFGEEMGESSDYLQCDWTLANEASSLEFLELPRLSIEFTLSPTEAVGNFQLSYLVFQVLEIPPVQTGGSIMEEGLSSQTVNRANEVCGLNRIIISGPFGNRPFLACGNLTGILRWRILDYNVRRVSLRTKNLAKREIRATEGGINTTEAPKSTLVYRGIRAHFYEKSCLQLERILGEGVRIRSHRSFPNDSYAPGICQWELHLNGGDYELSFNDIQFRRPENYSNSTSDCDTNNPDLDYLEIRASVERDSPLLARYCAYNQLAKKQKALILNMRSLITITFVAGIKQLSSGLDRFASISSGKEKFGFDMELVRVRNESQNAFCRRQDSQRNIYNFIRNREHTFYDSTAISISSSLVHFLYPKNIHCVVNVNVDDGFVFNISFVGVFDLETSKSCQNDFVQLEEVSLQSVPPLKDSIKTKITNSTQLSLAKSELVTRSIGKWCGKVKPQGYFLTNSSRIRITFHSNERIEGKGFQLEYSVLRRASNAETEELRQ